MVMDVDPEEEKMVSDSIVKILTKIVANRKLWKLRRGMKCLARFFRR
jgi:hypothetical protein